MAAVPDKSVQNLADVLFALLLEVEFHESFTLERSF
jgi:hypothetical protein